MTLRRLLALLTMMLLLAGCYRQSDDSFQTVNSEGEPVQQTPATPTDSVLIIDPNAGSETPTPEGGAPATATEAVVEPAATVEVFQVDEPTATIVIIEPTIVNTPEPPDVEPTTLPTATPPTLITPMQGNPLAVTLPTGTPTTVTVVGGTPANGLQATPTDIAELIVGECDYEIVTGDNLYRIALNNGVELAEMLSANNLSETSIIQPGQILKIPGCVEDGDGGQTTSPAVATSTPVSGIPQATSFPSNTTVHTVVSGDTLSTIARQYGVSVQSIVDTNKLANPDRLAVGDQLIIPAQP